VRKPRNWIVAVAFGVAALLVTDASVWNVAIAVAVGWLFLKVGYSVLGGFSQLPPEPPPPGELRKVKLIYRCAICGTEVRMTSANDEVPEPPRHCLEDMELLAPIE
jgi:hypothetical protein